MRSLFYSVISVPLLPLAWLLAALCPKASKRLILADSQRWTTWQSMPCSMLSFCHLFLRLREFRSVVYRRLGWRQYPLRFIFPGQANLTLACQDIGPGLIVQHGYSTVVAAKRVGSNFHVNQCVNIVWNEDQQPTIGDNVTVCAGAIVVGGVTIGDNVTIGAGAVVVKDVPSDSIVVGNPARIISKQQI